MADDNNVGERRYRELDILKGIAILLVVLGHSGSVLTHFVYLFHVSVFFMASGLCYKRVTQWSEFISFAKRRIIRLYVPYVSLNLVLLCLNHLLINLELIGTQFYIEFKQFPIHVIKVFLLVENSQLIGAAWFLRILLLISLVYAFVDLILSKLKYSPFIVQGFIAFAFYCIGYYLWYIKTTSNTVLEYLIILLTVYILFYFGWICHYIIDCKKISINNELIMVLSFVILLACNYAGGIVLGKEYGFFGFSLITGVLGWIFLWNLARILLKYIKEERLFSYMGRKSIGILLGHLICFKLVTIMQIIVYHADWDSLTMFPIYIKDEVWSIIYTIVGVCGSLGITRIYEIVKVKSKWIWKKK